MTSDKRWAEILGEGDRIIAALQSFDPGCATPLMNSLTAAKREIENPTIDVAFVGTFSSGKSSLINALLRAKILPEGRGVVTSRPVWIEGTTDPFVGWLDTRGFHKYMKNVQNISQWVKDNQEKQPHGVGSTPKLFVDASARWLERNSSVASKKRSQVPVSNHGNRTWLRIGLSEWPFKSGLRILDTPGFNSETTAHREMVVDALSEAEVGIVVIEPRGMSADLRTFIAAHVARKVPRVAFVLNQMDLVDAEDVSELLKICRRQASQELGMEKSPIIACSARGAIDETTGLNGWQAVRDWIEELAQNQLRAIVCERVLTSLKESIGTVQATLDSLSNRLRSAIDSVDREIGNRTLSGARPLLDEKLLEFKSSGKLRRRNATLALEASVANARSKFDRWLGDPRSRVTEIEAVNGMIHDLFVELQRSLASTVEGFVTEESRDARSCVSYLSSEVQRRASEIEASLPQAVEFRAGLSDSYAGLEFHIRRPEIDFLPNEGAYAVGGAMVGAIVGSVVPVIGTALGAVIGVIYQSVFGNAREEAVKKIRDVVDPQFWKCLGRSTCLVDEAQTESESFVTKQRDGICGEFESYLAIRVAALREQLEAIRKRLRELEEITNSIDPWKRALSSYLGNSLAGDSPTTELPMRNDALLGERGNPELPKQNYAPLGKGGAGRPCWRCHRRNRDLSRASCESCFSLLL